MSRDLTKVSNVSKLMQIFEMEIILLYVIFRCIKKKKGERKEDTRSLTQVLEVAYCGCQLNIYLSLNAQYSR